MKTPWAGRRHYACELEEMRAVLAAYLAIQGGPQAVEGYNIACDRGIVFG